MWHVIERSNWWSNSKVSCYMYVTLLYSVQSSRNRAVRSEHCSHNCDYTLQCIVLLSIKFELCQYFLLATRITLASSQMILPSKKIVRNSLVRPCSHHRFETRTVPEPFQLPVFRPVPLRPLVPERADHLAMWSQWNRSGTVPVGSVVWTVNWTHSGTSPVSEVASCTRVPACACTCIICVNACYASFYHNMSCKYPTFTK